MVELFFANNLTDGFWASSSTGQGIVFAQICASIVMCAFIIYKLRELKQLMSNTRRLRADIMTNHDVLGYYYTRTERSYTPIENIYYGVCERLVNRLSPEIRTLLKHQHDQAVNLGAPVQPVSSAPVQALISKHEMGLVESIGEQALDAESLKIENGMGMIATVVAIAPMLGLLGTVWGVLDAFSDMGTAGSATIATMAPAISSALVTTVVGLLIAIPGVCAHNYLTSMMRQLLCSLEGFTDDLIRRAKMEHQA